MIYEGWANYQTWNVALWLNNEEPWYRAMVLFLEENPEGSFTELIETLQREHIIGALTPDGVSWTDPTLDYQRLNEMLSEHVVEVRR